MTSSPPSRLFAPRLGALGLALAAAALAGCRPAAEPPAPEVRPVRTYTVEFIYIEGGVSV
ncbi:MAG: hypothetical protein ACK5OR_02015 [Betaproteobacteria bacterium]